MASSGATLARRHRSALARPLEWLGIGTYAVLWTALVVRLAPRAAVAPWWTVPAVVLAYLAGTSSAASCTGRWPPGAHATSSVTTSGTSRRDDGARRLVGSLPGRFRSLRPHPRPSSASGECRPRFETRPGPTTAPELLYPPTGEHPPRAPPARVSPRFFGPATRPPLGLRRENPDCCSLDSRQHPD